MSNVESSQDLSGWGDVLKGAQAPAKDKTRNKEDGLFITMEVGKSYRVRLVESPLPFRQHWNVFNAVGHNKPVISPAWLVEEKDKDVAWSLGGYVPGKKYAALVFDRSKTTPTCPTGKLRILQGGEQIFKPMREYVEKFKINPAGPEGPDWDIEAKKTPENQVEYSCLFTPEGKKPFTQEELNEIAKFTFDWRSQYKKMSSEEIRALWESLPEDKKYNKDKDGGKSQTGTTSAPVTASVAQPTATTATAPTPTMGAQASAQSVATPSASAAVTSNPVSLF